MTDARTPRAKTTQRLSTAAPSRCLYDRAVPSLPLAMARFNYRLARLPLQLIEVAAVAWLPEESALRLGYEKVLIDCDRAAAYLLDDRSAHARACALREQTAPARTTRARSYAGSSSTNKPWMRPRLNYCTTIVRSFIAASGNTSTRVRTGDRTSTVRPPVPLRRRRGVTTAHR